MTLRLILETARVGFLRLLHGRHELLLTFVVPVVFFTIFALIFTGGVGSGRASRIKTAIVNLDSGATAADFVERLKESDALKLVELGDEAPLDPLDAARDLVLRGKATVAVAVPEGWSESLGSANAAKLYLLSDSSDQVGPQITSALVQETLGELLAETTLPPPPVSPGRQASPGVQAPPVAPGPPPVEVIDILSEGKANPVVSMYAAGIAVMFLLFSATGAAGSLLEEEENQTLERLLTSRLTMTHLLAGKWLQLTVVGAVQIAAMFAWAQIIFGVDVLARLDGFLLMTLTTAAAAAALALALAAACRSRAQLNAVSVILVLTMSALGGSMVPRYIMSDTMQQFGRATFNAWAIDGYTKLFWRDLPTADLWPELAVMTASTIILLIAARILATRWETA